MGLAVSVIIVNWNGAQWLPECLSTLRNQTLKAEEIIVVDNASSDVSEQIATNFGARWLPMPCNIGLAPALNAGARVARGDVLLFLNNDMRFDERFIESLLAPMCSDGHIFASDALQYNWEGQRIVHWACRLEDKPGGDMSHSPYHGTWITQYKVTEPTDVALTSAAAMMVRRDMFETLGGFDRHLPMGYEDLDICLRAWTRGWRSVFVPTAICWHHVSASTGKKTGSAMNVRGIVIGKLTCSVKFAPLLNVLFTWSMICGGTILKRYWRGVGFSTRWSGILYTARRLPALLHERAELRGCQRIQTPFPVLQAHGKVRGESEGRRGHSGLK